jgi:ABC-type multidrug transport system fused ATPase/permease subunit
MTLFSKWVVLLIGFALTIIIAQLGLFRGLSNLFVKIIFIPNKPWLGIVFFFLIIFILSFISRLGKMIEKKLKKSRENLEKEKEKINRKTLETITDSSKKMFK